VYLFGEGAGWAETGEGRCKLREWGGKEKGWKWEYTKNSPKT